MKGVFKCGPLLALSIIFGLSLVVCSDTNAKRYNILAIPITSEESVDSYGGGISNQPFQIGWTDFSGVGGPNFVPDLSIKDTARYFSSANDDSLSKCLYNGNRGNGIQMNSGILSYQINSYLNYYVGDFPNQNYYNLAKCNQTSEFGKSGHGNIPHPDFKEDSFYGLTPVTTAFYKSLLPYYYDYSHIYLSDDAIDVDGVHYKSSLKMSDVTNGVIVTKPSLITIPLGNARTNIVGEMTEGRQIEFDGVFNFRGATPSDPESFSWSPVFLEKGHFQLVINGLTSEDDSSYVNRVDCQLKTRSVQDSALNINEMQVSYTCPFIFDTDFLDDNVYFYLDIGMGSDTPQSNERDNWWIFKTDKDWVYTTAFVITDNDSTPAEESWNADPTGNNLKEAPGSAIPLAEEGGSSDADWFSSLTNLFSFNLFNPFYPLFTLFIGDESCAQIPTIASMIHSEETEVCHWFSSSTRNIVTPVLGLASMMLLFGFVVHWLGSSSTSVFDDAGSISPPGWSPTGGTAIKRGWRRK